MGDDDNAARRPQTAAQQAEGRQDTPWTAIAWKHPLYRREDGS
jgi:hypothetical protein